MPGSGVAPVSGVPQGSTVVKTHVHLTSPFLDGLAPRDMKEIVGAAKQRHFLANSVVVNQGHPADHLFLLTKGRARFFFNTHEGKEILLLWLKVGEIFGGTALLSTPATYLVSTETLKDSSMLVWDRSTLRALTARYPKLLENGLRIASDYLAWYLVDHVALISQSARQRLAGVLVYLSETIGRKMSEGFEFDATNEELASAANVTPFTASRFLSEWQRKHTLVKRRGKILLRSPEHLFSQTV